MRGLKLHFGALLIVTGLAAPALRADGLRTDPAAVEFFETTIRPVLAENCFRCHGPEKQKGHLRLDSRTAMLSGGDTGPAIVPGQPERSLLIEAVNYDPTGYQMPPTGKLNADQIAALTEWIRLGAPWPQDRPSIAKTQRDGIDLAERARHWSFQPIRTVTPPSVQHRDWPRSPLDAFILARLEAEGLSPAPAADKRTLLRRVTSDLTGLTPTVEEIERFVSDDSPDAFARVVDRLLASPAYGERWGRHWLDLVRFAETGGHEFDYDIPHAWVYRDYVIRAWNDDLPYDQLVREHLAGDLLPQPRRNPADGTNQSVIGTAFYWFGQFKHSPVDLRAEECETVSNQLDVFGKTFLGLTVACARCHDHKFDPITARDYYALAGFLQSSRRQLARIDPPEDTRAVLDQLRSLRESYRSRAIEHTAQRLRAIITSFGGSEFTPPALRENAAKDGTHPLHPWIVLNDLTDAAQFNAKWTELAARWRQVQDEATVGLEQTVWPFGQTGMSVPPGGRLKPALHSDRLKPALHSDRLKPALHDWFSSGFAFGTEPTKPGELIWRDSAAQPIRQVLPAGTAHSGRVSRRLHGFLRSPTFTIEQPYIFYRMARQGGPSEPGRPLKNGQVHLIIDGFQAIKNPLYGGLTLNVPQTDSLRWHQQDVRKFLGQRAYIEIEDTDDGQIVLDQVVFSDKPPVTPPNSLIAALLTDPRITDRDGLQAAYRHLFAETLDLWQSDRLDEDRSADRIELLNLLLDWDAAITSGESPQEPPFTQFIEQQRAIEAAIPEPRYTTALADGTPENEFVLIRGNPHKPGDEVPRRFLEVFAGREPITRDGSGRRELAERLVDGTNPLVPRVLVNRLWQHHFGRGLVPTPDDFGHMGQPPSHPELLDYLANEFVRSGWSIKHLHRLMLLSSAYQMSSQPADSHAEQVDPRNVLLHRMNVQRLEAEAIRDAMLALSGRLDQRMYGPSVPPYLTPFMEGRGRPSRSGPLDGDGRRSIYINVRRNFLTPMFLAFDFPTPFTTMGRRGVSNVPAQALTLMNNPFVVQQARHWAEQLPADEPTPRRIQRLYEAAFGRPPTATEIEAAERFLESSDEESHPRGWADLCHVLWNVKEFVFIP